MCILDQHSHNAYFAMGAALRDGTRGRLEPTPSTADILCWCRLLRAEWCIVHDTCGDLRLPWSGSVGAVPRQYAG